MTLKRAGLVVALGVLILGFGRPASAYPLLQLDIGSGVYDPITQTIFTTTDPFTLYAVLTPGQDASPSDIETLLNDTYYVSAALVPKIEDRANLGEVGIGEETYQVTRDFVYGRPPLENDSFIQMFDPRDLAGHGVFDTYFTEVPFQFSAGDTALSYNTQDNPGGLVQDPNGTSYYAAFQVDTTALDSGYELHFDLYSTQVRECVFQGTCGDEDVNKFAPFTHDAQSTMVPEPDTASLVALGLIALVGVRRRLVGRPL